VSETLVQDLLDAGIHFGQRRSGWNPRMKPYIWGQRNKIHIIDIRETIKGLLTASRYIQQTVGEGRDVCFIGTKRQAKGAIEQHATDVGMPWVVERWLGGTLTNFRTIRERLNRLEELEKLVDSGEIESYSKKRASQLQREKRKIHRNLSGIRDMNKLPGALVVIDTTREENALREARTLGIPTIGLVDTDGDPTIVDIPIPGNDDSMRSIDVVVRYLIGAVRQGLAGRNAAAEGADVTEEMVAETSRPSSSSRAAYRGEASATATATAEPKTEEATTTTTDKAE
jgi:small subunit ribosomal protein S2